MASFKNVSIRLKVIILIVATSSINTLILSLSEYYREQGQYLKNTRQRLGIMAKVIGENNTATILFNGKREAISSLSALKADTFIEFAEIVFPDSTLFVRYQKQNTYIPSGPTIPLLNDTGFVYNEMLFISHQVFSENELIAYLRIGYSLREYKQNMKKYIISAFGIFGGSIVFAILLAYFFQNLITRPIRKLEQVVNKISNEQDYSIRSVLESHDEIGKLSDGFNSMIARIEQQNNELKQAKAQSDEALKAKERFLANITHEIRTPLSSIIGLISLVEDTPLNSEQFDYFQNMKSSSNHLLSIINDLLEFSRIGSGKFIFEKKPFPPRHTISRIEGTLEFELRNRGLAFQTIVDENVPKILVGDEFRLNQILINLLGNAIKFTPKGKISVQIAAVEENEKTVTLEFKVRDTGIGISKDKLQSIFDSFIQESSSTNRKYGGTGLGLTITKQLVELQNGSIWVESEKDKGSCFSFRIPYEKQQGHELQVKEKKICPQMNLKIMLIDDNELNLRLTTAILKKHNFTVLAFNNGKDALDALKSEPVDLILLDLHMPELDGYQISQLIRKSENQSLNHIPIVALTAAATNNEIQKCFECGMNDYIVKPFNNEDLVSKIISLGNKK
jgi:two-component system, sensor histidine kinase